MATKVKKRTGTAKDSVKALKSSRMRGTAYLVENKTKHTPFKYKAKKK